MNTLQASTKPKQKPKSPGLNPLEAFGNSVANDLIKPMGGDIVSQILGLGEKQNVAGSEHSGDLQPGVELDMRAMEQKKKEHAVAAEPAINYHHEVINSEKKIHAEDQQHLQAQMQEIIIELKRLTDSSKELEIEFKDVAVVTHVVKPSKYHVNFFEWVLATIRQARAKVEDSAHWMSAMKGKGNKKSYWNMFKQHGTSFGMSNERSVATQTG